MSYILEALKKSEQERHRGKVPDLQTIQEELPEEAARQKIWPYLLAVGVVALNIVAFILLPKSHDDTGLTESKIVTPLPIPKTTQPTPPVTSAPTTIAELPEETPPAPIIATNPTLKKAPVQTAPKLPPPPAIVAQEETAPQLEQTSPKKSTAPIPVPAATSPKVQAFAEAKPAPSKKPAPQPTISKDKLAIVPAGLPPAAARKRPRKKRTPSADLDWLKESETSRLNKAKIFALDELPNSVKSDLPEFNISAHFYANNPQGRMISLNGNIVRQGQTVSPSLRLEEITEDGAIFKYRDIRFKVDVF